MTHHEVLAGVVPNMFKLSKFGCTAYIIIRSQCLSGKFDSQARKGMFVGYTGAAYRVYLPQSGRKVISQYVRSIQDSFKVKIDPTPVDLDETVLDISIPVRGFEQPAVDGKEQIYPETSKVHVRVHLDSITQYMNVRRSSRSTQEPERYIYWRESDDFFERSPGPNLSSVLQKNEGSF